MIEEFNQVDGNTRYVEYAKQFKVIEDCIKELFNWRFITYPEESRLIEAIARAAEAKQILEIGMHTGYTTLHLIRAVYPDGKVVAIDGTHHQNDSIFEKPEIAPYFEFVHGRTPDVLQKLHGRMFDLVFVDSDHSLAHCEKERVALWPITKKGTIFVFHDCPEINAPKVPPPGTIFKWLHDGVRAGWWRGTVFPTGRRIDCERTFGKGYDKRLNPNLGIFIRN